MLGSCARLARQRGSSRVLCPRAAAHALQATHGRHAAAVCTHSAGPAGRSCRRRWAGHRRPPSQGQQAKNRLHRAAFWRCLRARDGVCTSATTLGSAEGAAHARCARRARKRRPEAMGHGCGASFCRSTRQPSPAAARRGVLLPRWHSRSPTLARGRARSAQAGRLSAKSPSRKLVPSYAHGLAQRTFVRHSCEPPCSTGEGASRF